MRQRGAAILYISHRIDEIVVLVDVVTVLRNGQVVSAAEDTPIDIPYIVTKMIGRSIEEYYPKERNANIGSLAGGSPCGDATWHFRY